ncbi:hypothetical protein RJ641_015134 [Dillenia turbinata]|uniref:Uncharacterized protein n=1 Tax=Dillenia turbinata TaxID=194707 RepID=A0AAN8Z0S8_9MAGN
MGRQNGDPTVITSSIALLQERFRQLERARERREEKEFLKLFSDSDVSEPISRFDPAKLSQRCETTFPPPRRSPIDRFPPTRPHVQDSLPLGLGSQSMRGPSTTLPTGAPSMMSGSTKNYEHLDVDTSLHL